MTESHIYIHIIPKYLLMIENLIFTPFLWYSTFSVMVNDKKNTMQQITLYLIRTTKNENWMYIIKKTYTKRSMKKNPLKITLLCIQAITIDRHACNYLYTVNYLSNPNKSSKVNKTPLISVHVLVNESSSSFYIRQLIKIIFFIHTNHSSYVSEQNEFKLL